MDVAKRLLTLLTIHTTVTIYDGQHWIRLTETELDFQTDEVSNFLPMSIKENDFSIFAKFEC